MEAGRTNRSLVTLNVILVVLIVAILLVPRIMLGGLKPITLKTAPALTGQISQALAAKTDRATLPAAGKDYSLGSTRYFDNDIWAVATIASIDNNGLSGAVVLKKAGGIYKVVLGPGTSFPSNYTAGLPSDLKQYLNEQGYIYGTP